MRHAQHRGYTHYKSTQHTAQSVYRTCCDCEHVDAETHPDSADRRLLRCDHCGHVTNRDRNGARNIEAVVLQWQLDGTRPRHLDGPSLRRFPSVGDPPRSYDSYDDDDDDDDEEEEEEDNNDDDVLVLSCMVLTLALKCRFLFVCLFVFFVLFFSPAHTH